MKGEAVECGKVFFHHTFVLFFLFIYFFSFLDFCSPASVRHQRPIISNPSVHERECFTSSSHRRFVSLGPRRTIRRRCREAASDLAEAPACVRCPAEVNLVGNVSTALIFYLKYPSLENIGGEKSLCGEVSRGGSLKDALEGKNIRCLSPWRRQRAHDRHGHLLQDCF